MSRHETTGCSDNNNNIFESHSCLIKVKYIYINLLLRMNYLSIFISSVSFNPLSLANKTTSLAMRAILSLSSLVRSRSPSSRAINTRQPAGTMYICRLGQSYWPTDAECYVFDETLSDKITPDGGCYFKKADPLKLDWGRYALETNHEKLMHIKRKYDPSPVYNSCRCIGWTRAAQQVEFLYLFNFFAQYQLLTCVA